MKDDLACPIIRKLLSVYVLAHSRFVIRCCPMAESQVILPLLFLHIRGGCSLTILRLLSGRGNMLFYSVRLSLRSAVLRTELHICTKIHRLHNFFEL